MTLQNIDKTIALNKSELQILEVGITFEKLPSESWSDIKGAVLGLPKTYARKVIIRYH